MPLRRLRSRDGGSYTGGIPGEKRCGVNVQPGARGKRPATGIAEPWERRRRRGDGTGICVDARGRRAKLPPTARPTQTFPHPRSIHTRHGVPLLGRGAGNGNDVLLAGKAENQAGSAAAGRPASQRRKRRGAGR